MTCGEALKAMDRLFSVEIDVNDVACFIIEPVQGEGGFLALDIEFAQALRRFCDEHHILLIADEIQSGFGRTGQRFAFSRLGIEPDLIRQTTPPQRDSDFPRAPVEMNQQNLEGILLP